MEGSENVPVPAEKVIGSEGESATVSERLAEAQRLQLAGDLVGAVSLLEETTAEFPEASPVLYSLGHLYLQLARFAAAERCYRRLLTQRPSFLKARMRLAAALEKQGKLEAAAEEFQRARQQEPGCLDASVGLGVCLLRLDRCAEALATFEECLQVAPQQEVAQLGRGVALRLLGRSEEAEAAFAEIVRQRPELARDIEHMRRLYGGPAMPAKAAAELAGHSGVPPEAKGDAYPPAGEGREERFSRVVAAYRQGEFTLCATLCREMLGPGAAEAAVWNNLGAALWCEGKKNEALAAWEEGLKTFPEHPQLNRNAAMAWLEAQQWEKAAAGLALCLRRNPEDGEGWFVRGLAEARRGSYHEAAEAFAEAYRLHGAGAAALVNLGVMKQRLGDYEAARKCYEQALAEEPDLWEARLGWVSTTLVEGELESVRRQLVEWEPNQELPGELWLQAAFRLLEAGRREEALASCRTCRRHAASAEAKAKAEALEESMAGLLSCG